MSNPINVANKLTLRARVLLAVMPVLLVMAMLFLLERFGRERILFSSLAASAFLIYLDPRHPTNSVRTLVIAQSSAAIIGYLVYVLIGTGYWAAAISMVIEVILMILCKAMHPPAVATALVFAFQETKPNALLLFLLSLLLLVFLIGLQRTSIWLIKRGESRTM